jgi:type IV secretory pathway protease TraF
MSIERFLLVVTFAAASAIATVRWSGATVNVTNSEPTGLYLHVLGSPTRGGMVVLRPLLKHVAAMPGDVVRVTPEGSYINGKLWPYSGVPVTPPYRPFPFGTYTLQLGQYWLLGSNPESWDSRYIGPIPVDLIAGPIRPIWMAGNGYAPATRP